MKGIEDSPGWIKKIEQERKPNPNIICKGCKIPIVIWHCPKSGCVWCAKCGAEAKDVRDKRKDGQ